MRRSPNNRRVSGLSTCSPPSNLIISRRREVRFVTTPNAVFFALVIPDEEAEHSDWEAEPERRPPLTPEDELEQDSEFGRPRPRAQFHPG